MKTTIAVTATARRDGRERRASRGTEEGLGPGPLLLKSSNAVDLLSSPWGDYHDRALLSPPLSFLFFSSTQAGIRACGMYVFSPGITLLREKVPCFQTSPDLFLTDARLYDERHVICRRISWLVFSAA